MSIKRLSLINSTTIKLNYNILIPEQTKPHDKMNFGSKRRVTTQRASMPQINFNPSMLINQNYADPGFTNYMSTNPNMFQTQRNLPPQRNIPNSSRHLGNFNKEGSGNMDGTMGQLNMGGFNHSNTNDVNRYNNEYFQEGGGPKKKQSNLRKKKNKSPLRKNRSGIVLFLILNSNRFLKIFNFIQN